ncbi:MAG: UDP-N-acetylmuramoyl-L-alanyl-D-glutamate--2,6-diaminopimelate ligase [Endomicrobium sp.]|nr:UDP-N-acetylmuramoyl-L-alanyl-D-glutamate--2,6-diaminopimelate ligase [Endomicrobium sp.]
MKLKEFLSNKNIIITIGDMDTEIAGISYDSRYIYKDYVFFALPGYNTNGKKYINEAISKGASVVVTNSQCSTNAKAQIVVNNIFHFMSFMCNKFYNYPDRELYVIGITGTNGKTTVTYMIESILKNLNIECGVIGTINYRYKDKIIEAINTTPQSLDIFKIMREMVDSGIKYLVMEVSSHALSLGRVYGVDFDMVVFTNLTRDHLDFHKNMNNYFKAKFMLFKKLGSGAKNGEKYIITNGDDKYGKKISKIRQCVNVKFYSVRDDVADLKAENIKITMKDNSFDVIFDNEKTKISMKHIGVHNVYNALAALGAVIFSGISLKRASEGLNNFGYVPGRFEKIDTKNLNFEIIVDYAHTNDALKNVLQALQKIKFKKIITVFGCGGDRDRAKRPLMGKIAVEMSDFVFVTSDNPRLEDPYNIILDIEIGIKRIGKKNYKVVVDREMAIKEAVMMAEQNDIVLISGKGHETYQIIGMKKFYFNDIEIAKKYVALKEKQKNLLKQIGQKEFTFK